MDKIAARLALPAILVIVGALALWHCCSDAPLDFLTYRFGALDAWRGLDVYRGNIRGPMPIGQPFTYTPFAALTLLPTTLFSWRVAYLAWTLGNLLVLAWVLNRFVPAQLRRRAAVVAGIFALALLTCVVRDNVTTGQIDLTLMGLCLADVTRRDDTRLGRWLPRGVLIGIAAAVKLTPGLFIVFALLSGQRRLAGWALAAGASATGLAAIVLPHASTAFFASALWTLPNRVDLGHPLGYGGNQSLVGLLVGTGLPAPVITLASAGAALAIALRTYRQGRDLDAVLIIGLAAPLVSPFSWLHHLVYLLPAVVQLAFRPRRRVGWLVLIGLCLAWAPAHSGPLRATLVLGSLAAIALLACDDGRTAPRSRRVLDLGLGLGGREAQPAIERDRVVVGVGHDD